MKFSISAPDPEEIPFNLNPFVFPKPLPKAPGGVEAPPDPGAAQEACVTKVLLSGVMGYAMGMVLGVAFGSYEGASTHIPLPGERELPKVPLKEQLSGAWRGTATKSMKWGMNFLVVTAVFSGTECLVEKYRAKHDLWNGAIGGCATGAALAAKQGPAAMCLGCAGFAAFSTAMDHFMGGH